MAIYQHYQVLSNGTELHLRKLHCFNASHYALSSFHLSTKSILEWKCGHIYSSDSIIEFKSWILKQLKNHWESLIQMKYFVMPSSFSNVEKVLTAFLKSLVNEMS